jgi:hypothetical protein
LAGEQTSPQILFAACRLGIRYRRAILNDVFRNGSKRPPFQRSTRRHAFYEEFGHGGRHLLQCVEHAHTFLGGSMTNPQQKPRTYVPNQVRAHKKCA